MKMSLRIVQALHILARRQIRMDELDKAVEILGRHGIVLLVKVVDVAVENLDKELDADGRVHAGIGDTEGALQALEDAFAVAVGLENKSVDMLEYFGEQRTSTYLFAAFSLLGTLSLLYRPP